MVTVRHDGSGGRPASPPPDPELLAKEQEKRDQDPIFYCRWIANKPILCFGKLGIEIHVKMTPESTSGVDLMNLSRSVLMEQYGAFEEILS